MLQKCCLEVMDMPTRSLEIVTSALDEEECLPELFDQISKVMRSHPDYDWKIIICDNGSSDSTWEVIKELSLKSSRVLGVRMSRTFPLDAAFTMGIDLAESDSVIIMASDLQDPPEVIHEFLRKYEEGYEQVVAKVISRQHVPFIRRTLSNLFYVIANKATNNLIPRGVSDFRLLSRPAYLATQKMREKNRFLRGLIAWTGFRTAIVEIERPERFAGDSKFTKIPLFPVIKWAISSILSHTSAPLSSLAVIGFVLSGLSILATTIASVFWIFSGVPFAGFGTLFGVILLGFSLTMFAIGIIAQYVALIYEEVKARPIYLIAERTDGHPR
jgi:glycosyltransferase involved in cell wall biosynthesis